MAPCGTKWLSRSATSSSNSRHWEVVCLVFAIILHGFKRAPKHYTISGYLWSRVVVSAAELLNDAPALIILQRAIRRKRFTHPCSTVSDQSFMYNGAMQHDITQSTAISKAQTPEEIADFWDTQSGRSLGSDSRGYIRSSGQA